MYTIPIRKVTSGELLVKNNNKKQLYTKNKFIIKLLLNVFIAGTEAFIV
jgi:hypothetical protein